MDRRGDRMNHRFDRRGDRSNGRMGRHGHQGHNRNHSRANRRR
jgi:hypothetical protein